MFPNQIQHINFKWLCTIGMLQWRPFYAYWMVFTLFMWSYVTTNWLVSFMFSAQFIFYFALHQRHGIPNRNKFQPQDRTRPTGVPRVSIPIGIENSVIWSVNLVFAPLMTRIIRKLGTDQPWKLALLERTDYVSDPILSMNSDSARVSLLLSASNPFYDTFLA